MADGLIFGAEMVEANEATPYDHILFKVIDTGVGIADKDIEFIFQKFYRGFDTQVHSTGIYKFMGAGPGLGLTIAKGILRVMGVSSGRKSRHDLRIHPARHSTSYFHLNHQQERAAYHL